MKREPPPVPPPLPSSPSSRGRRGPPPSSSTRSAARPVPTSDGFLSTQAKLSLAAVALQLRDEQVEAQVVHYKADLQTSPELDAITAQVVAELQELQRVVRQSGSPPPVDDDRGQREIELIASLKGMLARLFRRDRLASVVERKMAEASKRFARLFFVSELAEKLHGETGESKVMRYPEQVLFHILTKHRDLLELELRTFEYAKDDIQGRAQQELARITKELRDDFLARTTPELNALVKLLNEVLLRFFTEELPLATGDMAWEVVKEARLADSRARAGYKISADAFPSFRSTFERRFLERLVTSAAEELLRRVRDSEGKFRGETLLFVSDPQIFSDVCELVCDAIYDFLYNDAFLDLPADWRARLRHG